jgi:microcin C transport system permease protein
MVNVTIMLRYIAKRLLLMIPTLLGIMVINFLVIQLAPGGPVEQMIAKAKGQGVEATARFGGTGDNGNTTMSNQFKGTAVTQDVTSKYRGAQGLDPEFIKEIEKQFGFDKPLHERFWKMLKDYSHLDFGTSYFRDTKVTSLIKDKLPVSISLGLWTTIIIYLISIPLGIKKAVNDGNGFDIWTSAVVLVGYAVPSFLFGVFLIVLFAGGRYFDIFPLRGLTSDNFSDMSWYRQILDYLWHLVLPVASMVIGGFASLTMLTKNSFLEEINKQYVLTARAKGLSPNRILYKHVFRNAMLIVIAGFPAAFIGILFTSSLLIEVIFSLDGLGLLGFESAMNRDYPVIFGALFIFTLIGLVMNLISDLTYVWVDPRIDFNKREN